MWRKILFPSLLFGLLSAAAYLSHAYLWWPLTLRDGQLIEVELRQHLFASPQARLQLEVAKAPTAIVAGLSGRPALVARQGQAIDGLLFVFADNTTRRFWMREMRFAIDICWLSRQRILACDVALPPAADTALEELEIYASPSPVEMVLETNPAVLQQLEGVRLFPVWQFFSSSVMIKE
jgi:uncharacterized membrane protein (UPF0127 family)